MGERFKDGERPWRTIVRKYSNRTSDTARRRPKSPGLFSDAYGVPSDQQKNLDDKIAKDLTPERQSAIQGVLPRLDGIVKSMSKSDVQAFHQSVQKLQSATSMEEYQRGVHEAINSVNDPAAKAQLSKYYEDLYKAMGPRANQRPV